MEASTNIAAAACMQGGMVIFDSSNLDSNILAHDSTSSLTYGVAIHEGGDSMIVAEVEFDARKLNKYSIVES